MRHSRAAAAAVVALTLGLTATACSSGSGGQSASSDGGPVALRMVTWTSNKDQLAVFQQIADTYVAAHGDEVSSVKFEGLAGDDYVRALSTQIAGGDVPDLAWVQENNAQEFIQAGVLADLTPALKADPNYDLADILPQAREPWTKDGNLYGYPFSNSPFGVYVNTDMLKQAGQPTPAELIQQGQWTWDKLAEVAAATAKVTGKAGLYVPYSPSWDDLEPWMLAWGARPWSEDGKTCTFTSQQSKDFFTWLHDGAYTTGGLTKPGENADFPSGGAAFMVAQLSKSGGIGSFAWDWVPLPKGPAGQVNVIGQAAVGVIARSPHAKQAADFLAFFTNKENSAKLAAFFPPPRQSLLNVDTLAKAAPNLTPDQIQHTIIDVVPTAVTKPGHVRFSQFTTTVRNNLDTVFSKDRDLDASLQALCDGISPILGG
jgi:multiple sugar transport system substrate-binding protein